MELFLYYAIQHATPRTPNDDTKLCILRYLLSHGADPNAILPQTQHKLRAYEYALQRKALSAAVACFEARAPVQLKFKGKHVLQHVAPKLTLPAALNIVLSDLPFSVKTTTSFVDAIAVDTSVLEDIGHHQHFTWTTLLDCSLKLPDGLRTTVLKELFAQPMFASLAKTELYSQFSLSKDEQGRRALSIADKATRYFFYDELMFCGRYELYTGPPMHRSESAMVVFATDYRLYQQLYALYAVPDVGLDCAAFKAASQHLSNHSADNESLDHQLNETYKRWDKDQSGALSEVEWLRYCSQTFGEKFKVALKFMRFPADYRRELAARATTVLNPAYIVPHLPTATSDEIASALASFAPTEYLDLSDYKHLIVMPPAARSLEDVFRKERPSATKTRKCMHQVAKALATLHAANVVHGDVKMHKVLRLGDSFKLIDLDASCAHGQMALGAKFTSGTLPPECFYKLQSPKEQELHQVYWGTAWKHQHNQRELWAKMQPSPDNVVVRAFHGDGAHDLPPLPYSLVEATPAFDLWALGCMLFKLCSVDNTPLLLSNRDEDLEASQMLQALRWTDDALVARIGAKVPHPLARDLIGRLLRVAPADRLPLSHVVDHPYFTAPDATGPASDMSFQILEEVAKVKESLTRSIHESSARIMAHDDSNTDKVLSAITTSKKTLMHAMYEATEVHVPTSFVLLPCKAGASASVPPTKLQDDVLKFVTTLAKTKASPEVKATSLFDCFRGQVDAIGSLKNKLFMQETMYLYLLDEATGDLAPAKGVYPIAISTKTDDYFTFVDRYLPLIQGGFTLLRGVDKITKLLGVLGVPKAATEIVDRIESVFGEMEGNVNKLMQEAKATKEMVGLRGPQLRQLEAFFEKRDPAKTFSGLRRVPGEDGRAIWTVHAPSE
ncbi:serine/threonine protein kinase [Saprolegnia parasitica CBS 223.65]|uniref:Serine/threonine protein kinase n=1 Tax=Saprolegnia parasitica (strain CBS 223.65) TaxID=695850 RepID=A0A067CED1_SAPPC|nr:serine/threonine protein kinase [Saprolegnia parasitica CBS 223.65]KDO24906.1 serine/threonine protein kinase [Saprolegnia parasitica CBS 223.65]|eukprot:XP_012204366.1 serine/threonine protein kinase [Saprolegnia parasitica CBS 223.65]